MQANANAGLASMKKTMRSFSATPETGLPYHVQTKRPEPPKEGRGLSRIARPV